MEYFGVFVADENLSRRFRVFRDSILVGPGEGDFLPIRNGLNGAQLVGTQDGHPGLPETGHRLLVGMPVGIVLAQTDDAVLGIHFIQKAVAGGGVGAVVAHLQNVRLPVEGFSPVVQHVIFRLRLHVASEQEIGLPVGNPQDDGGIVGFGVGLYRPQHRNLRLSQRKSVAGGGDGDFQTLLVGIVDEFVENAGRIGLCGGVDRFSGVHYQHGGQAAHMILVGVGADDGFQLLHALLLQKRHHQLAVVPVAAVNEHKLSVAFQKGAVRLAHIDELDGEAVAGYHRLLPQVFRDHIAACRDDQCENSGNQFFLIYFHHFTHLSDSPPPNPAAPLFRWGASHRPPAPAGRSDRYRLLSPDSPAPSGHFR